MARLDKYGEIWANKSIEELKADYMKHGRESDFNRIASGFFVREMPEKEQCKEFLRDCRGMLYGDSHKENCGSFTLPFLIEMFHGNDKIKDFYDGCIYWRLSELQGGGLVI